VKLRLALRWKILVLTVMPLVTLAVATLWTVNTNITRQVNANARDDLQRASALFESILTFRTRSIATAGEVIVRDPRFFSVLTLPGSYRDPNFRATAHGIALDFNAVTQSDLFEIYGRDGTWLASAAHAQDRVRIPPAVVRTALNGHPASMLLVGRDGHYQVCTTPVSAGGHVIGALLLGSRIDQQFAEELRGFTRSEVSFLSGNVLTGTTLTAREDRNALIGALAEAIDLGGPSAADSAAGRPQILRVQGLGQTYLTLARRIPDAGPGRRQLFVMQRSLDAETAFLREIQRVLLEVGFAAVIAALLAGVLISEHITAPVRGLVRAAQAMEHGDYEVPLRVRTGDEIGYLASAFEDMRRHLRVYVSSLEEVARLRSEFISIASHELRTPITVIRGFQELMDTEALGPLNKNQHQAMESIDKSLTTLTRIAEDATRLSLIENEQMVLQLEDVAVAALAAQAIAAANESGAGRHVRVTSRVAPGLGIYRMDGSRMALALANLVRNGIRFTPDGGSVEVRAREADGIGIVFEVCDTGTGMSEERRRRLFEREWQVRSSDHHHSSSTLEFNSAGLGLGFSIARGIFEAHGGTLEVESEVGRGTTVRVQLPLTRVATEVAA
jgi:signal transduction histidine kinase